MNQTHRRKYIKTPYIFSVYLPLQTFTIYFTLMSQFIDTTPETIYRTNHELFRPYLDSIDKEMVNTFYGECGKEHFRFLAYLSSIFQNTTIVNIHTNGGYEALALSYNESNTVYSFDAIDHITNPILVS